MSPLLSGGFRAASIAAMWLGLSVGVQASTIVSAGVTFSPVDTVDIGVEGADAVATATGGSLSPDASGSRRYAESEATGSTFGARSISYGTGGGSVHPRFQASASLSVDDLVFVSSSGSTDPFSVTLTGLFSGTFSSVPGYTMGIGYARARMDVGNLYDTTGRFRSYGYREQVQIDTYDSASGSYQPYSVTDMPISITFDVYSGVARSLSMSLMTEANGGARFVGPSYHVFGTEVDFTEGFKLDPAKVFDLPSGVTVSSASWGLVDNSFPHLLDPDDGSGSTPVVTPKPSPVPLPAGLPLLFAGLGGLSVIRRRT